MSSLLCLHHARPTGRGIMFPTCLFVHPPVHSSVTKPVNKCVFEYFENERTQHILMPTGASDPRTRVWHYQLRGLGGQWSRSGMVMV